MALRGHEVTVYCRSGHHPERQQSYLGMQLRYLPAIHEKHLETLSHTALSAFRLAPDTAVVCMGVGNAPVVRSMELMGRRCVFNVDGADWQRTKWGRFASWYLHQCELIASRSKSILVADAIAVQKYYATEYGRETELVPYGADAPTHRGTGTLERFGLDDKDYALFVGRLVPENGAHDFLEAIRIARVPVRGVVVGDAPFERNYVAQLRRNAPESATFTGYQFGASYEELTSHARLFVLAASVGGTHPVLLEQMAAGNCILSRDTASNREVLDGSGLFWSSPEELASLLEETWPDSEGRQELGRKASERVAAHYSWDAVTDRYLEMCRRTLS